MTVFDPALDDYPDTAPTCPHCGSDMEWEPCEEWDCEDGYRDVYEDDPFWYEPGETEPCQMCEGKGGWWSCPQPATFCSGKRSHG